jgi:hypothetical protein
VSEQNIKKNNDDDGRRLACNILYWPFFGEKNTAIILCKGFG